MPALRALATLWPYGLPVALLLAAHALSPFRGEPEEWLLFLTLGATLPPAMLLTRRTPWGVHLALAAVASAGVLITADADPLQLLDITGHHMASLYLVLLASGAAAWIAGVRRLEVFAHLFVAWCLFTRLMWWQSFARLLEAPGALIVSIAVAAGITWILLSPSSRSWRWLPGLAVDLAACLLFAWLAQRTVPIDVHHGAFLAGPAHVLRHGGTPLWDTPAQYGHGMAILMAMAPHLTAWSAMAWLVSLGNAAYAIVVYFVLSRVRPGPAPRLLAVACVACVLFALVGNPPEPQGPQQFPMVGGIRFLLPALQAAWPFWAARRGLSSRSILAGMAAVWIVAASWSCDVALWCTSIGWPAALWLRWTETRSVRALARLVGGGIALLGGIWGADAALYAAVYHHLPDPRCFFEYTLAYQEGFGAAPINLHTGIAALILTFAVAWHTATERFEAGDLGPDLVAAGMLIWTATSYFVGRSVDHNAVNIAPLVLLGAGVVLQQARSATTAAALAPLLACLMMMASADVVRLWEQLQIVPQPNPALDEGRVVDPDSQLQALIDRAGIGCNDAVTFLGPSVPGVLPGLRCDGAARRPLLPAPLTCNEPANMLGPLPPERRGVYLQRFFDGPAPRWGWVVSARPHDKPWLEQFVREHYRSVAGYEDEHWRVERVEAK